MATGTGKAKSTPEVVEGSAKEKAPDTHADGGGEQASGTEAMQEVAEQVTEAKPLADSAKGAGLDTDGSDAKGQPEPSVNQPDGAVEQMRLDPSFATRTREAPYLPGSDSDADSA